jgi:hypothetical protein
MLKPLTLSLGLALALGAASVSKAGGHHGAAGCDTCGLASPQGSPQSVVASPQSCETCAPAKKHCFSGFKMPKMHFPKHTTTYEWVLKKKHVWSKGCGGGGCGNTGCGDCGGAPAVYPTSQVSPAPQAAPQYAAPQYAAPSAAGQTTYYRPAVGEMRPALAADEVPPAPTIATGGSSLLQLSPSGN